VLCKLALLVNVSNRNITNITLNVHDLQASFTEKKKLQNSEIDLTDTR